MKKILIIMIIIVLLSNINKVKSKDIVIPNDAIRFRIVANSNSKIDQDIKLKLSLEIEKELQTILKDTKDSKKAKEIIQNNIINLNKKIKDFLKREKYSEEYTLVFGDNFFPEKNYNGIIYEKGHYDTLTITLGKGKGHNWWCILFPPLCLMEAEKTNLEKVEYKFFIKEILDKYL